MFGIDLLDTFGDWLELAGCIFAMWLVPGMICGILQGIGIPSLVGTFAVGAFVWLNVYDYDIILGLLLGSVLSIWLGGSHLKYYRDRFDERGEHRVMGTQVMSAVIGVIMIVKVVLNMMD